MVNKQQLQDLLNRVPNFRHTTDGMVRGGQYVNISDLISAADDIPQEQWSIERGEKSWTISVQSDIDDNLRIAAERTATESIPDWITVGLQKATDELKAKGGCPGCQSMIVGIHLANCQIDNYD